MLGSVALSPTYPSSTSTAAIVVTPAGRGVPIIMSRRGWGLLAGIVSAILIAVVVVVIVRSGHGSSDDESVESDDTDNLGFPPPESSDARADRDYLEGDGRVLLVMHDRAQIVAGMEPTAARCEEEAAALDRDASADEVLSRIGGLVDPVLRDAFHAERTALGVALTECISGERGDERLPDLAQAVEAVDVRLNELGE